MWAQDLNPLQNKPCWEEGLIFIFRVSENFYAHSAGCCHVSAALIYSPDIWTFKRTDKLSKDARSERYTSLVPAQNGKHDTFMSPPSLGKMPKHVNHLACSRIQVTFYIKESFDFSRFAFVHHSSTVISHVHTGVPKAPASVHAERCWRIIVIEGFYFFM